jgi:transposase-like protein
MFEKQYGEIKVCTKCGVVNPRYYRVKNRKCYECNDCGFQLHPLANTIFHKSSTSLKNWFYILYLFSVSKNGVSAMEVQRHIKCTYKTSWRMCKQVRTLMQEKRGMFDEPSEADETFLSYSRKRSQRKSHWDNKTAIVGIVEKKKGSGQIKAFVTKYPNATVVLPFIRATIKPGGTIHTDESRIYSRVKREFNHEFVNHSKNEYVRAGVSTNVIEGFWGQLKRSVDGTYHSVSPKYLSLYLGEFTYRYNHRDHPTFPVLASAAVLRVR